MSPEQNHDSIGEGLTETIIATAHVDVRSGKAIKFGGMTKSQHLFSIGKKVPSRLFREIILVEFSNRGITISTLPKKRDLGVSLGNLLPVTLLSIKSDSKLRIFVPWKDVTNYANQSKGKYISICIEAKSAFISIRACLPADESSGSGPKRSYKIARQSYDRLGINYKKKIFKKDYSEGVLNFLNSVLSKYRSMGLMTNLGISINRICATHQREKRYFENTESYHCETCDPSPFEKEVQDRIDAWASG